MLGKLGSAVFDAYISGEGSLDTNRWEWNNFWKFGPGVRLTPFSQFDLKLSIEYFTGKYFHGGYEGVDEDISDLEITLTGRPGGIRPPSGEHGIEYRRRHHSLRLLGHVSDGPGALPGRHLCKAGIVEHNVALLWFEDAGQAFQQRALPRAVGTEERQQFALGESKRDIPEDGLPTVVAKAK